MESAVYFGCKKHPVLFLLKFLLFVLIFVLVTALIGSLFSSMLGSDSSFAASALGTVGSMNRIVVLDAGHGGEDGGASSADGTLEKDLNLAVTLLLADNLRAAGIEVILTRETDRMLYDPTSDYVGRKKMLDLKERLEIARKTATEHQDAEVLFISIHMNAYPSESVRGLQVWYSANNSASLALAESIQSNVRTLVQSENDRKVKKAGTNIYLLDRLDIPAILIECGFLSTPEEAALLETEEYRRELMFAIFTAILNYESSLSP